MKKTMFAAVLTAVLALSTATAWADGRAREHDGVNAEAMSLVGLAAASIVGTGVYLVRRRKQRQ
jgi:LPXTG-motif cell wall-anchored protein